MCSIVSQNKAFTDFIIGCGDINVNVMDSAGWSALSLALFVAKDMALADAILKAGADINAKFNNGKFITFR